MPEGKRKIHRNNEKENALIFHLIFRIFLSLLPSFLILLLLMCVIFCDEQFFHNVKEKLFHQHLFKRKTEKPFIAMKMKTEKSKGKAVFWTADISLSLSL